VRGSAVLPRGTGKTVRVAVFAEGAAAEAAKKAGADIVGFQDLADQIKAGVMDFDVVIASPDAMRVVGQLRSDSRPAWPDAESEGRTVTPNVAKAVENAKAGQVQFRIDKVALCTARSAKRRSVRMRSRKTWWRSWRPCTRPSPRPPRASI